MTNEPNCPANRRWTQSDITDLRTRSLAGENLFGIARALTRTEEGVRHMAARLAVRISNQEPAATSADGGTGNITGKEANDDR